MRILVTAGPTREYIDTVRFLSNPSTGKMGFAVAREAAKRGHEVVLVSGPVALRRPQGVEFVPVISAAEMARACLDVFDSVDAVVMAAAPCDFGPRRRLGHKEKKSSAGLTLELAPTQDILLTMGQRKRHQVLVGFAVEDRDAVRNAQDKLARKNLDAIVLNRPAAFGADHSDVELLGPAGIVARWTHISKQVLARRIIRLIEVRRH